MALDPELLESLPDSLVEMYSAVEADILGDMARRIAAYDYFIPAAQHQLQKLQELGAAREEIIARLSATTGQTQAEIVSLLSEAASEAIADDVEYYTAAEVYEPSKVNTEALYKQLNSGLLQTQQAFFNITGTTADTATKQFEHALDRAWMQINTGGFDYNTAVKNAVKDLSKAGIGSIKYKSGRVDNIEVAVRRAVVTGANQTALKTQEALADELEVDLVETTAHGGARPTHAKWQGKVFSRKGRKKVEGVVYEDLAKSTGYGRGDGLGGWNCRHTFHPYIPGAPRAYSKKQLKNYDAKNIEYNGVKMTEYEASQIQRGMERNIRRWKRENAAMKAAGLDTTESAAKIRQWQDTQKDFLNQTGLKRQSAREQIAGYGKNEAAATAHDAKVLQRMLEDARIKATAGLPKTIKAANTKTVETLGFEFPSRSGVVPKGAELSDVTVIAGQGTSIVLKDWKRLYNQHGGDPIAWQKKVGTVKTDNFSYEVHWHERDGVVPDGESKVVRVK